MRFFAHEYLQGRKWSPNLLLLSGSVISMTLTAPASAQATGERAHRLETIIVTAQKKEQSVQDVAASIEAFDTEQLELRRIQGIEGIGEFVPGFYATPNAADSGGVRAYIRGIGTTDPQIGLDTRVALYMDGIYLGKTQGIAFDIPDLARVEVLSGPQGTLYGRNTVAGAVNIVSQTPQTGLYSGHLTSEYGSFNQTVTSGHINIPVSEIVAVRIAGLYEKQDGWVKNSGPGDDFGGRERSGWRISLGVQPDNDFSFVLAADYLVSENQGLFYQAVPGSSSSQSPFAAATSPFAGRLEDVRTSFPVGTGKVETMGVSFTTDYTFNPQHELKFILGYRKVDATRFAALAAEADPAIINGILNRDLDNNPANGVFSMLSALRAVPGLLQATKQGGVRADYQAAFATPANGLFYSPKGGSPVLDGHEQVSAELTFNGALMDGRLEYTGGLYYFDEDTADMRQSFSAISPVPGDVGNIAFLLGALEPIGTGLGILGAVNSGQVPSSQIPAQLQAATAKANTVAGIFDGARESSSAPMSVTTQAFAIYTQWIWHATDRLRFTGGLRFSDESRNATQQPVSLLFADTVSLLGNKIAANQGSISFDNLDPAVIVEFDVNDDVMLYGSYKESFRSGGFNQAATRAHSAGRQYGDDFIFDPEEMTAWEAGFKGDFANGRFRVNGAVYYYQFENEQAVDTDPDQVTRRVIFNRDSKLGGFELSTLWAATRYLNLSASYAWADGGDIDAVDVQFSQSTKRVSGVLLQSPENSYNLGLDYRRPFGDRGNRVLFASLYHSHRDETHVTEKQQLTARDLLSGRIGIDYTLVNGSVLNVSLWGQNLTNEVYTIDALPLGSLMHDANAYGQPRTIGISAGVKF